MMTQAERLIRNLCEERRQELLESERQAIKDVPQTHTWMQLPPRVRALVLEYRRLEKRQAKIQQDIKQRGYSGSNSYFKPKGTLYLADHDWKVSALKQRFTTKRERVQALKTNATIASLGKSAQEAQAILKQLQKDLRGV